MVAQKEMCSAGIRILESDAAQQDGRGLPRQKVHDLGKQRFACVHDSPRPKAPKTLHELLLQIQIGDISSSLTNPLQSWTTTIPLPINRATVIVLSIFLASEFYYAGSLLSGSLNGRSAQCLA
jgi:hypothetical protein